MTGEGWERMVYVREHNQIVTIYTRPGDTDASHLPLCIAVQGATETVVVSVELDPGPLGRLAVTELRRQIAQGGAH